MTQDYFGTKRVTAWHAEKDGAAGYGVKYADGHQSWSPAEAFEAAYRPITSMSFGHAIEALKAGHKVARHGWNGKGMFLFVTAGSSPIDPDERATLIDGVPSVLFDFGDTGTSTRMPQITMHTATGSSVAWTVSQTDALAEDWCIVE